MDPRQAGDLIFNEARAGRWFPEALRGQLTLDSALQAQLAVRNRKRGMGRPQGGWKVGLTSTRVRKRYGTDARPFGHIMADDVYESGATISLLRFRNPFIEPELCFTIGKTLTGPGVTPAAARTAVASVCAAFELNQGRAGDVKDFPLNVADNLSQWGIVVGAPLKPLPDKLDLSKVAVTLKRGKEVVAEATGGPDAIDDHFLSLSILANTLAAYGEPLAAGMRVITGSFAKVDVSAGETWSSDVKGIGQVSVSFAP
jgi:2-keto-4-pentenoate hydratase